VFSRLSFWIDFLFFSPSAPLASVSLDRKKSNFSPSVTRQNVAYFPPSSNQPNLYCPSRICHSGAYFGRFSIGPYFFCSSFSPRNLIPPSLRSTPCFALIFFTSQAFCSSMCQTRQRIRYLLIPRNMSEDVKPLPLYSFFLFRAFLSRSLLENQYLTLMVASTPFFDCPFHAYL